jgi:hypothetical protein
LNEFIERERWKEKTDKRELDILCWKRKKVDERKKNVYDNKGEKEGRERVKEKIFYTEKEKKGKKWERERKMFMRMKERKGRERER